MSGASEQANGRASGSVLMFLFLFVPDHSAVIEQINGGRRVTANFFRPSLELLFSYQDALVVMII